MVIGESISFIVPEGVVKKRADKILATHFTDFSRSHIQHSFDAGLVKINGSPISKKTLVSVGDKIEIAFIKLHSTDVHPVKIPLVIVYEDKDIIVINKVPGIVVHPGKGTGDNTMVHALLYHTKRKLSLLAGKERPGVVHRLDKETSGLILFAKSDKAYLELINAFSERQVKKEYLALVTGGFELESGSIKDPIGRHSSNRVKMAVNPKGREAHTDWAVEQRFGTICTLLRCWLQTGRTHQIRVHLSFIRHPIFGDSTYGYHFRKEHITKPPRVLLHAETLFFKHPVTGKSLNFTVPLPEDFKSYLNNFQ